MLLNDVWDLFETQVFPTPSQPGLFNPYNDWHPAYDLPDAPSIRRDNLRRYLACYEERPPLLFLAEAPGPWGCRFSGVPLVSEARLVDEHFPIRGRPSSTRGVPHREYSAGIYWRVLQPYFPRFFTWNSVPLHPHQRGQPLSVRNPSRCEVAAFEDMLAVLVQFMQPERVVAVGRKAERALKSIGIENTYVRHPSQGGARRFEAGTQAVLREMKLDPLP